MDLSGIERMNNPQHSFICLFWICCAAAAFYGVLLYVITFHRPLWIRFLDAEESFWFRFGLPKGGFTRRFCEGRWAAITVGVLSLVFLFIAVFCVLAYFHFSHPTHRG